MKTLECLKRKQISTDTLNRSSLRLAVSLSKMSSIHSKQECMFCDNINKYIKNNTKDELVQEIDMRADDTLHKVATDKCDSKKLFYTTNDLVGKAAPYHMSCYRKYTRADAQNEKKCSARRDLEQVDILD